MKKKKYIKQIGVLIKTTRWRITETRKKKQKQQLSFTWDNKYNYATSTLSPLHISTHVFFHLTLIAYNHFFLADCGYARIYFWHFDLSMYCQNRFLLHYIILMQQSRVSKSSVIYIIFSSLHFTNIILQMFIVSWKPCSSFYNVYLVV